MFLTCNVVFLATSIAVSPALTNLLTQFVMEVVRIHSGNGKVMYKRNNSQMDRSMHKPPSLSKLAYKFKTRSGKLSYIP